MKLYVTAFLIAGTVALYPSFNVDAGVKVSREPSQIVNIKAGEVSAATAQKMITKAKPFVIDVRTDWEYASGHLENAVHIPLYDIETGSADLSEYRGKKVVVYCRSGRRSGIASHIMAKQGIKAVNLLGGIIAWEQEGYNVIK